MAALPVESVLDALLLHLKRDKRVVLAAPPGSGKSTMVAPFLWRHGHFSPGGIALLQPRRVAARTVARRISALIREPLGEHIGYQVRHERRISQKTQVTVMTEGVLIRKIQSEPDLPGISVVILDEFHERSLNLDLALGFIKEIQEGLREDLHLVVMSATLDAEGIAKFLDCEVVKAEGRPYEVEISYLHDSPSLREVENQVERALAPLLKEKTEGDILVFLPGTRQISRLEERLSERHRDIDFLPFHSRLPLKAQDRLFQKSERPRVILSTNIAETSVTLPFVDCVIDSGFERQLSFDPSIGQNRLETKRISKASATQRSGRAGRVRKGQAIRLWSKATEQGMAAFQAPEIERVELLRTCLEVLGWGAQPESFPFFERPQEEKIREAMAQLEALSLLDKRGLSTLGKEVLKLPLPVRSALWLVLSSKDDRPHVASMIAAIEEGLPIKDLGLLEKNLGLLERSHSGKKLKSQLENMRFSKAIDQLTLPLHEALLHSHGDRLGLLQDDGTYLFRGGRRAKLRFEGISPKALIAFQMDGGERHQSAYSLIYQWLEVPYDLVLEAQKDEERLFYDASKKRVLARLEKLAFGIPISSQAIENKDRLKSGDLLSEGLSESASELISALAETEQTTLKRVLIYMRHKPLPGESFKSSEALLLALLPILCRGLMSEKAFLQKLPERLPQAIKELWGYAFLEQLDHALPTHCEVPSGSKISLQYHEEPERKPVLAVRIHEVFGWEDGPRLLEGKLPVLLHLLSPARRPVQMTEDLRSFWENTWEEVRKDMRSRYPKHFWPEDPSQATASKHSVKHPKRRS